MDTRKMLFEKFEDVLALEYKMAEVYDECLHLSEDVKIISALGKIRDDELRHGSMARRLLEITQG